MPAEGHDDWERWHVSVTCSGDETLSVGMSTSTGSEALHEYIDVRVGEEVHRLTGDVYSRESTDGRFFSVHFYRQIDEYSNLVASLLNDIRIRVHTEKRDVDIPIPAEFFVAAREARTWVEQRTQ